MGEFTEGLIVGLAVGTLIGVALGFILALYLDKGGNVLFERDENGRIIGIHYVKGVGR